tara:strand:+ start:2115 stop:2480 length:366 start_codon:yes stop_codon:yes gene_type:complete
MVVEHRKLKGNSGGYYSEKMIPKSHIKTNVEKLIHSLHLSNTCTSTVPFSVFLRKGNNIASAQNTGNFDIYILKDINIPPNTSLEILLNFKYDYNFNLMFAITGSESLTLDMIFKYEGGTY